jgi:carbon-monoxide dehydrogenase large subunit
MGDGLMVETRSVLGGAIRRREDPALIRGRGTYTDDVAPVGTLHVAFVRSPFAKAKVLSVDTSDAIGMPGVKAIYTIDDVRHLGPLPTQLAVRPRPLLADGEVAHVGEAVAMVVATDRYLAQDAAEAVFVDYEAQTPVIDLKEALAGDVKAHDDMDSNVVLTWAAGPFGDEAAIAKTRETIQAAKDRDDTVVVSIEMTNQRLIPTAIEPRSVVAEWSEGYGRFHVHSTTQIPHPLAGAIAKTFGLANVDVRVSALEVGGGFGAKLNVYPDEILVPFAAQQLGAPVKFTETRREAAVSTIHGRGWLATATMVGTRDGEILGYELEAIADMGAYTQNFTVAIPFLGLFVGSGQYTMPTYWRADLVLTNTVVTDAYRGAGRPEAEYYIERIIDAFSRKIGMDPAEVRKKNFFDTFTDAVSPIGFAMDTGDYAMNLDALLEFADYEDMKARRDAARAEGRLVGIGLSSYVEVCGFGPSGLSDLGFNFAEYNVPSAFNGSGLVRVGADGKATVQIGTGPSGQGHQTTWAQIVHAETGIPVDDIRVIAGETDDTPLGIGTFGSRSAAVDGSATYEAAVKVREKAAKIAAHLLEASDEDIRFADGAAYVAGSPEKRVTWAELAKTAFHPHLLPEGMEGGLEAHTVFSPANATWPFGSHLCMVEVDPDTGYVELLEYVTMDDCGNVINPMIVDGQLHGGIAQGSGQALFEEAIYDTEGNLLTTSMMDYLLPTAAGLPSFKMERTVTPTHVNPLGVKGIGEAGTIGSAQTIVNGVVDALEPLGVEHVDMPLRPRRVWEAIQAAKG